MSRVRRFVEAFRSTGIKMKKDLVNETLQLFIAQQEAEEFSGP